MCDRGPGTCLPIAKLTAWLPALALTNKKMHDEVTKYMLETTEWIDFKYNEHKAVKIASRFAEFLTAFPNQEAASVIRLINFPHERKYSECRVGKVVDEHNPDVQLMLACTQLETVAMTFHRTKLVTQHPGTASITLPRELDDFLNFFHLRPMLDNTSVKQVHLDGIYPKYGEDDDKLECLEAFAKWLVEGFRKKQGRGVDVFLLKRWKRWEGRSVGKRIVVALEVKAVEYVHVEEDRANTE